MIYLIIGENTFKRRSAVSDIIAQCGLTPERYDGLDLTENQLADCIAGATLFSAKRLVIINELSANKLVWDKLADWVGRVSDDTTLLLIEPKPDKRTKAYKVLSKSSTAITVDNWTDRQASEAARWLTSYAQEQGLRLTNDQVQNLIKRSFSQGDRPGSYVIDQQILANAVNALSVLGEVTSESISAVLPESSADNVFELLDAALGGNAKRTQELLHNLQATADPYMTLGFVMSQWAQLVALRVSGESPDSLAARIGVSAFVLRRLQTHAKKINSHQLSELTNLLARLDMQSKTTSADPWHLLARFIGELSR